MSASALDTPMMRQFLAIKAQHPDAIVFYRMGDFYEMFLEDAERAAPLLEIALTTRDRGKADAVPMCGVPVHSADGYVRQLAEAGLRVAICEQVEDPRKVGGRRLVKREVVEVITPGLVGDPETISAAREVSLVAICAEGLAAFDASTGDLRATAHEATERPGEVLSTTLLAELERIGPREVLISDAAGDELSDGLQAAFPELTVTRVPAESFDPAGCPATPIGFDAILRDPETQATAALLAYVAANQPFALAQAERLRRYRLADTMRLDAATVAHLELFENSEDRTRRRTLLERLDESVTPLGARRMRRLIAYPLLAPDAISERQDAVAYLSSDDRLRGRLREAMRGVRDLERIFAKSARPTATPRDLVALRASLEALPGVRDALAGGADALLSEAPGLPSLLTAPEPVDDVARVIQEALVDDPPALLRGSRGAGETGYIREGFRPELDLLRQSARKGREWIADLELRERERTGISNLKARFHPVHGYSLEVSKSNLSRVPEDYERKQTLANAERFTTPELREVEQNVLGSNDRAAALEREVFEDLRRSVSERGAPIRRAAEAVAMLDALGSLAEVARTGGWIRPSVDAEGSLVIQGGRHPVLETLLDASGGASFVPNDTTLSVDDAQILLLTGPNMSGKSTYLRQVALLVLLAQIGSCVPAEKAQIGVVDRIFTRVGASDRLARGESTFMVEMRETAEILDQASPQSLIILDEIGRGTSTFDGLSIAWAVVEHLHDATGLGARTLFATHYHELTGLESRLGRLRNAHFEVREFNDDVIFLRRIASGGANRSYGIQVARLAGLPVGVTRRAQQILKDLEGGRSTDVEPVEARDQLALFQAPSTPVLSPAEKEVLDELRNTDSSRTTPLAALESVDRWVRILDQEKPS